MHTQQSNAIDPSQIMIRHRTAGLAINMLIYEKLQTVYGNIAKTTKCNLYLNIQNRFSTHRETIKGSTAKA
jgi:hypothetical protein